MSSSPLKSWFVETSAYEASRRDVDHQKHNEQLNGSLTTVIFGVADGGKVPLHLSGKYLQSSLRR
jgi:hypothetical protein